MKIILGAGEEESTRGGSQLPKESHIPRLCRAFFKEHSCFLYMVISESGLWTATKINNDKKVIFYLKLHHNISVAWK